MRDRSRNRHGILAIAVALAAIRATGAETPAALDGQDIYARVIANRFDAFFAESSLLSGDETGRTQISRFEMHFRSFRNATGEAERGVLSKTLVTYTHPFDLRHSSYLVIQNEARIDDQFLYLPTRRRTIRVNLRGEAVFGTDFSFEDVIPSELEHATYHRLDDAEIDGQRVYVVEAHPAPKMGSAYSKLVFHIDPERFVPLRTHYWNEAGVRVKELSAARGDVERFDDVWVPTKVTMRHLLFDTFTVLEIQRFEPGEFDTSVFDTGRLETH